MNSQISEWRFGAVWHVYLSGKSTGVCYKSMAEQFLLFFVACHWNLILNLKYIWK